MRIPSLTLLTLDQFPNADEATKALVAQLNTTQATLYSALQGRLTLPDNITSQTRVIQFTTAADYTANNTFAMLTFDRTFSFRATHLILTQCINTNSPYAKLIGDPSCTNWQDVNGQIQIYYIPGLQNGTPYQITVLLF